MKKDARLALLLRWQRGQRRGAGSVYWCAECKAYHLTTKKPDGKFRQV